MSTTPEQRPAIDHSINTEAVLSLFSGKAHAAAVEGLTQLYASLALGEWIPGVSKRCRSVLNPQKANEAHKVRNRLYKTVYFGRRPDFKDPMYHVSSVLSFGERFVDEDCLNVDAVRPPNVEEKKNAVRMAKKLVEALRPVNDAMKILDDVRPKAVITTQQASPTVTRTMNDLGATKIEVCPMKWVSEKRSDGTSVMVAFLDWPAGTRFGTSRFSGQDQCQACGHGIRNAFNWLPLVLSSPEGPRALWVGSDCGHNLFGFKVKGTLEIKGERKGLNTKGAT